MDNEQDDDGKNEYFRDIIMTKLAYERCAHHISCARAILHIHDCDLHDQGTQQIRLYRNLWHILNLVSHEIDTLNERLNENA